MEIIELEDHPWFVASQFHPEFKSKPDKAHPLFREFIRHALLHREKNGAVTPEPETPAAENPDRDEEAVAAKEA